MLLVVVWSSLYSLDLVTPPHNSFCCTLPCDVGMQYAAAVHEGPLWQDAGGLHGGVGVHVHTGEASDSFAFSSLTAEPRRLKVRLIYL